jgi:hypothetical protein
MEREFYEELRRLEEEANVRLEARPEISGLKVACHAMVLPSFSNCTSYTLMVSWPDASSRATGVKRVWRREADLAKFEGPTIRLRYGPRLLPTIDQRETTLDPALVATVLARATALQVPPRVPLQQIGADGTSYVMVFGDLFLSSRFAWWEEAPPGWDGVHALLQETASLIDGALA